MGLTPAKQIPASQRIGESIRIELARRRLSQRNLIGILGLRQGSISARIRGEVEFRIGELEKLADYFGVTLEQLISEGRAPDNSGQYPVSSAPEHSPANGAGTVAGESESRAGLDRPAADADEFEAQSA